MLHDCPECGEAYSADSTVTMCPRCDNETTATFARPLSAPKTNRKGAWAAGLASALVILVVSAAGWAGLDVDGDGASTYREYQEGTEPFNPDSDGDGLLDGFEIDNDLDPLQPMVEPPLQEEAKDLVCSQLTVLLESCEDPQPNDAGHADDSAAPTPVTQPAPGGISAAYATVALSAAALVAVVVGRAVARR